MLKTWFFYRISKCIEVLGSKEKWDAIFPGLGFVNMLIDSWSISSIFGCVCYVYVTGTSHEKLDPRAVRCVFTGYPTSQNALIPLQKESMSLWIFQDFQINPIFMTQPRKPWVINKKNLSQVISRLLESLCHLPIEKTMLLLLQGKMRSRPISGRHTDLTR